MVGGNSCKSKTMETENVVNEKLYMYGCSITSSLCVEYQCDIVLCFVTGDLWSRSLVCIMPVAPVSTPLSTMKDSWALASLQCHVWPSIPAVFFWQRAPPTHTSLYMVCHTDSSLICVSLFFFFLFWGGWG